MVYSSFSFLYKKHKLFSKFHNLSFSYLSYNFLYSYHCQNSNEYPNSAHFNNHSYLPSLKPSLYFLLNSLSCLRSSLFSSFLSEIRNTIYVTASARNKIFPKIKYVISIKTASPSYVPCSKHQFLFSVSCLLLSLSHLKYDLQYLLHL